jgi:hypothetical protein
MYTMEPDLDVTIDESSVLIGIIKIKQVLDLSPAKTTPRVNMLLIFALR